MRRTAWTWLMAGVLGTGVVWGEEGGALNMQRGWTVEREAGAIGVFQDGELFTRYLYPESADEELPRPILYPIIGPGGVEMTRNYPMRETAGEAHDHPHHRSLWYGHGDVNGIDFWAEGEGKGRIVQERLVAADAATSGVRIETENAWIGPKGNVAMRDRRRVACGGEGSARWIDFEITLVASEGAVRLGDTKEGTMAIRTNPNLRLEADPKQGVERVSGRAVNSEGERDKGLWGKRAAWVDYCGEVEGKTVGIAIMDWPGNPRHPTWWHAREYGLVAANPFGVHDFEKKPAGIGDLVLEAGATATFRYRFVFHEGDAEVADVGAVYEAWVAEK